METKEELKALEDAFNEVAYIVAKHVNVSDIEKMENVFWQMTDFAGEILEGDSSREFWDDLIVQWNSAIDNLKEAMKK